MTRLAVLLFALLTTACNDRSEGAIFWALDGQPAPGGSAEPCQNSLEAVKAADAVALLWARHSRVVGWGYERVLGALRGRQVCLLPGVEMCGGVLAVGCTVGYGDGAWAAEMSPKGPVDYRAVFAHEVGHMLEAAGMTGVEARIMEPLVIHAMGVCGG